MHTLYHFNKGGFQKGKQQRNLAEGSKAESSLLKNYSTHRGRRAKWPFQFFHCAERGVLLSFALLLHYSEDM